MLSMCDGAFILQLEQCVLFNVRNVSNVSRFPDAYGLEMKSLLGTRVHNMSNERRANKVPIVISSR